MKYAKIENNQITQVIETFHQDENLTDDYRVLSSEFDTMQSGIIVSQYYWDDDQPALKPERPSSYHFWNWSAKSWDVDTTELFNQIRHLRNQKLYASDWTQVADSPLSEEQKTAWRTYRQSLRDFIANNSDATDLDSLVWPTEPS